MDFPSNNFFPLNVVSLPSVAQLVERRTVEALLISLGRWFESGSKESFTLLTVITDISHATYSKLFYSIFT